MYKSKGYEGKNNISGARIANFRKALPKKTSQRLLAVMMTEAGVELDKNAIQRIECGKRFVTDIELRTFAKVLNVTYADLLDVK